MTNFKGISKLKKEKANKILLEIDLVNQYKNATSNLFKTVIFEMDSLGDKNVFYYLNAISGLSNSFSKELQSNKVLKTIKEIEYFNRITIDLLKDIVQFFIAIDNYDSQDKEVIDDIILYKTNIEDGFKNLGQFDLKIKEFFTKADSSIAIAMREYCFNVIKKSFYFLNNSLYISIEKCLLKADYDNLINDLKHSIVSKEVDFNPNLKSKKKIKKIPEKWYALLYWFELKASGDEPPIDIETNFIKSEIVKIGREKCNSSGQNFYKFFIQIDINNQILLKKSFGKDWKELIKKLSNNDTEISKYIDENYID